MSIRKMCGVNTPLATPLTSDQQVDYKSFENLCEYLIGAGVHGLYCNGTTGEMCYLSHEERERLEALCVRVAAGRTRVYSMVGCPTTKETIALARHAEDCGCDGIGVVTPYYYKLSDNELFAHFTAVARSVSADFPVYLYSIPQCAVNDITPSLAERIAETCPNVIGMKYSFPSMPRLLDFMQVRGGDFSVLTGPDDLFFATLACGGDGVISGNANVIPEYFVAIYDAFQAGDLARARKLQEQVNRIIKVLSGPGNMSRYKEGLVHRGVIQTAAMRAPLLPISAEDRRELIAYLESVDYTHPENYVG